MISHTVDWDREVELELGSLWLNASDRNAVARAQAEIDYILSRNPEGKKCEHLSEGMWRLTVPPLAVNYTIDEEQRHVQVVAVRLSS